MRFLTTPECEELTAQVGLDQRNLLAGKRVHSLKNAADFFYQSPMKGPRPVANHLLDRFGDFTWAMLWVYGLPWGDRSREENAPDDWQRYARWRRSAGEHRALYNAPGKLFEPNERSTLIEVIEFAIHTGWDAIMLARPLRCVITLSHDDVIKIQSRHNLSALAKQLQRLGLSPPKDFHVPRQR
jgi:hypothetical protein